MRHINTISYSFVDIVIIMIKNLNDNFLSYSKLRTDEGRILDLQS